MSTRSGRHSVTMADAAEAIATSVVPTEPVPAPAISRIALLDDHPVLRAGTRQLLELDAAYRVFEFGSAKELMSRFESGAFDLLLLDLSLPDRDGLALLPQLRLIDPALRIIVFSVHDGTLYRQQAAALGADALISKRDAPAHLIDAVRHWLATGPIPFDHGIAKSPSSPEAHLTRTPHHDPLHTLTPREREVFLLLARGHGASRVAAMLQASRKTIYTHRERLLSKLGCANDAELAIFGREQGIV